jgi:hypothetical protein
MVEKIMKNLNTWLAISIIRLNDDWKSTMKNIVDDWERPTKKDYYEIVKYLKKLLYHWTLTRLLLIFVGGIVTAVLINAALDPSLVSNDGENWFLDAFIWGIFPCGISLLPPFCFIVGVLDLENKVWG